MPKAARRRSCIVTETANALCGYVRSKRLTPSRAGRALAVLLGSDVPLEPLSSLVEDALELAQAWNLCLRRVLPRARRADRSCPRHGRSPPRSSRNAVGARRVIVSLHVTTGAAGGALVGSRAGAFVLGLALHGLGDAVPHHDIDSQRFEIASGATALLALAARYGPFHPVTIGALAASAPDIEHVLPLPRAGRAQALPEPPRRRAGTARAASPPGPSSPPPARSWPCSSPRAAGEARRPPRARRPRARRLRPRHPRQTRRAAPSSPA